MRVQNGFIVDVSKYCDRWCGRCPLANRCRLNVEGAGPDDGASTFEGFDPARVPPGMESSAGPDPVVVANTSLRKKRRRTQMSSNPSVRLAVDSIDHFMAFVMVTMFRAIAAHCRGEGSTANGYGKAILVALDGMRRAWRTLVDTSHFTESDIVPFLREIDRMERNALRVAPKAREFIRPGFDEPDEVAMLETRTRH